MIELISVQKTVMGGRTLSFRALCVVGDKKGRVGLGIGKARETINAIEKGFVEAKKNMITVPIVGTTIPHEIDAKFGASKVKFMPAKEGAGVIAGGAARAVLEIAGIKDVTGKLYGSRNKVNSGKATFEALKKLRVKEQMAAKRGKTAEEV
ncbi:MAG: 30S ribosomal protein S5 [Firmicutes bacterium]|nr:30S ribosomal protein S5 [Bacillota bacterium]